MAMNRNNIPAGGKNIPAGGEDAGGKKKKNTQYKKKTYNTAGGEDAGGMTTGRIAYDTNNTYTEVELDRENTITLTVQNNGRIRTEELFAYLDYLNLLQHTECIQRLQELDQSYEITIKKETNPEEFKRTINQQQIIIEGKTLTITPTRKLKAIRRNPITKVLIFEAPYELEDKHIITKLSPYGILQTNKIFNHKYRGTEIYNGVRSVNFTTIVKPIPTTLFVRGNRLKLKHEGQDRTPICGICKERGHYRNDCPGKETYTDRDNLDEDRQEQETWSNIVKQGQQQRERREEEQRKLYMEEVKKQDEQNKRKRRQEETLRMI